MHVLHLFEAVSKSYVLTLEKKGLVCMIRKPELTETNSVGGPCIPTVWFFCCLVYRNKVGRGYSCHFECLIKRLDCGLQHCETTVADGIVELVVFAI
jgi:hypothetical protein